MIIKTEVTPEEKVLIKELAGDQSLSSYIREKALGRTDPPLMQYIEALAGIAQRMNDIALTVIENKVIYESEIVELLERMTTLEKLTTDFLKEVTKHGYSG